MNKKIAGNTFNSIFIIAIFTKTASQNIPLIKDYLTYSRIKTSLFVTCENDNEMYKIVTELQETNSYVNSWSISNDNDVSTLNYTKFFLRLGSPFTILINLNCEHVDNFLEQASQKILFHFERTWLIFSDNMSQSYDILSRENINMDAEITLVIPLDNGLIY